MERFESRYRVPMVAGMLVCVGWLVFIVLFAFYWSSGFTFFQDAVVAIVSLAVACSVMGAIGMAAFRRTGGSRP